MHNTTVTLPILMDTRLPNGIPVTAEVTTRLALNGPIIEGVEVPSEVTVSIGVSTVRQSFTLRVDPRSSTNLPAVLRALGQNLHDIALRIEDLRVQGSEPKVDLPKALRKAAVVLDSKQSGGDDGW